MKKKNDRKKLSTKYYVNQLITRKLFCSFNQCRCYYLVLIFLIFKYVLAKCAESYTFLQIYNAANALATMHDIESIIDLIETVRVRDKFIDFEFTV